MPRAIVKNSAEEPRAKVGRNMKIYDEMSGPKVVSAAKKLAGESSNHRPTPIRMKNLRDRPVAVVVERRKVLRGWLAANFLAGQELFRRMTASTPEQVSLIQ